VGAVVHYANHWLPWTLRMPYYQQRALLKGHPQATPELGSRLTRLNDS
jgi:hypothetical protein